MYVYPINEIISTGPILPRLLKENSTPVIRAFSAFLAPLVITSSNTLASYSRLLSLSYDAFKAA